MLDNRLLNVNSTNSKGNEVKTNCSYTFNTDVDGQTRTLPDTYRRRNHAFVYLSAQSFSFDLFFTPLLAHLLMIACIIHLYPPIHPFIPSVRPSARPSICLPPTHAPTYPQLIIYRFCIHKNNFFWFNHWLILSCMSPSSSASLRTFINSSLVKSYLGQYGYIVPQLNEFRSIRLIFFFFHSLHEK